MLNVLLRTIGINYLITCMQFAQWFLPCINTKLFSHFAQSNKHFRSLFCCCKFAICKRSLCITWSHFNLQFAHCVCSFHCFHRLFSGANLCNFAIFTMDSCACFQLKLNCTMVDRVFQYQNITCHTWSQTELSYIMEFDRNDGIKVKWTTKIFLHIGRRAHLWHRIS